MATKEMELYDIEALKIDLPTAKELSQYVYDKTSISLDLIGKPKEEQYLAAKNALEGKKVPETFVSDENPYVNKQELVPVDDVRQLPPRNEDLPPQDTMVHHFGATNMPHPLDPQSDKKVHITFRKYDSGVITYQIVGPIEPINVGTRINKYGQPQPEKISWLDPRTEERLMRRVDGSYTEQGRKLHTYCVGEKGAGIWPLIDRDMVSVNSKNIADPWA